MVEVATRAPTQSRDRDATAESPVVRAIMIGAAIAILSLFLFLPLATVFVEVFGKGLAGYVDTLSDPNTIAAIKLTLIVAAVCVPVNTIFGVAAAWCVARFDFKGKSLLTTLIDLPFSVSPVIAGLVYVLLFGARGVFGPYLQAHNIEIIFAVPGIVLATTFVTFPFVARELIPLMQQQGSDDEQAALTLGASPFQMFLTVTLPNINGDCSTACCSATRAPWASSARSPSSPAISAASPTRCRCTSTRSTTITTWRAPSPSRRCSRRWRS
jgi:sulfate transport system permease protein